MQKIYTSIIVLFLFNCCVFAQDADSLLQSLDSSRYAGGKTSATFKSTRIVLSHSSETQKKHDLDLRIRHHFGDDLMDKTLIREAWLSPAFAPFRAFAEFPVLDRAENSQYGFCAWFYDLRFEFPLLPPSFRYGACRQTGASEWEIVRERGLFYID